MTPEQIDTVTNGLINLHTFLDEHGPGLFAAATAGAGWWILRRLSTHRASRRAAAARRRQLLDECQQMGQPTTATKNRKEKPQP